MYAYLTYTKIMQRYAFFFYYANISLIFNTFCKKMSIGRPDAHLL